MTCPIPTVKIVAGNYRYDWPAWELAVMLDRIKPEGHNDLVGEIRIAQKTGGRPELLEHTKLNLMSMTTRNALVKKLGTRNDEVDWEGVITAVCHMTMEEYRKGEPVELIGGEPARMDVDYLLYPLLELNAPTTIFAPGDTGKSTLGRYIAMLVKLNMPGIYDWYPNYSGNVLYLDWEATKEEHQRGLWAIKRGLGIGGDNPEERIYYRFCTQPLADDIVEIQRLVAELNIILVIVDSQMAAAGSEPEKADSATNYYNALRTLRVTTLTLDHVTKSVDGRPGPFGSVAKWNRSRAQFELKKQQDTGSDKLEWALFHRKQNSGRRMKPLGIGVEYHYADEPRVKLDSITFKEINVLANPELAQGCALKDVVYRALLSGAMTQGELAAATHAKEASLRSTLNRYKGKLFVKVEGDRWGVVAHYAD